MEWVSHCVSVSSQKCVLEGLFLGVAYTTQSALDQALSNSNGFVFSASDVGSLSHLEATSKRDSATMDRPAWRA